MVGSGSLPPNISDDDNNMDCDLGPPDPRDDIDLGLGGNAPAA
jgi:hypothetical protein